MWCWIIQNLQSVVTSFGLLLDIIGAWFVAWEVVFQFQGNKFSQPYTPTFNTNKPPSPTESTFFKNWEANNYIKMKIGIALLTLGFILQIISTWMPK
jgi:hypothetical protein